MKIAIARKVPASFANALCAVPPDPPIDVARAREQHAEYRGALESYGLDVRTIVADETTPDCCFVEDTTVVAGGVALVTRPGAVERRAETGPVAKVLADYAELAHMEAPATLDGGDCMRVGTTIFVGKSLRTNEAGIARLAEVFAPHGFTIVPVALPPNVLHLKCICAPLGADRITLVESAPRDSFAGVEVVRIPEAESYAANVLAIGDRVLVAQGFPRTAELLTSAGYRVVTLDTSEFRKADGALTCLSVLL
jgi:dimethylargininase